MTLEQTSDIVKKIVIHFPSWKVTNIVNLKAVVSEWHEMIKGEEYADMVGALRIYVREGHEFAPTSGQLIDIIEEYKPKDYPSKLEAVHMLKEALRNSSYHAAEEFFNLPEVVRMVIGSPSELYNMSQRGFDAFAEREFRKSYEDLIKDVEAKKLKDKMLPRLSGQSGELPYALPQIP